MRVPNDLTQPTQATPGVTNHGYRPDIDGLRALAVTLVVLFHAGVSWLPGGFVGVDVFFVISGYLITGLLVDEFRTTGHISLQAFWARRVRRLGPALFLVTATVLPASMVWLSRIGTETGPASKAAMAALLLNANHYFAFVAGDYFAAAAETNPLLHMWSLSVEEQFYMLWPLALLALLRGRGSVRLMFAVGVALVLALAVAFWAWIAWPPQWSFYLMPARAWELLAGGLLAIAMRVNRGTSNAGEPGVTVGALLGLTLIIGAALGYTGSWGVPFPLGLAPVAGAVLVIWAGASQPRNVISRLAAHPWLTYIGRISYPLYLWHWPLLVLARGQRLWVPDGLMDTAAVIVAVLAAILTFELIEKPWQRWTAQTFVSAVWLLRFGGAMTAGLMICAGLVGAWARLGWGYSPGDRALAAARVDHPKSGCIFRDEFPGDVELARCYPQGAKKSVLLWGDSHASQWGPAIKTASGELGIEAGILALGGCMPMPTAQLNARCQRFHASVFEHLKQWQQDRGLRGLILASRWASGMGLESLIWTERVPPGREVFFDTRANSSADALRIFEVALSELLDAAHARGLRVLIVLPSPLQRVKGPHCLSVRAPEECFISRARMMDYAGKVEATIRRVVASRPFVRLFDPKDFMCPDGKCPAMLNGQVVYSDENHVTDTFARASAAHFLAELRWLTQSKGEAALIQKQ
jgi:peptidoglycan/LPS O-acetylase OafA/YrhL